jgi:hypothetical protein
MAEIPSVILAPHTARAIRPSDVLALYRTEGWWRHTASKLVYHPSPTSSATPGLL